MTAPSVFKKFAVMAFKPKAPVMAAMQRFLAWAKDKNIRIFFHEETPDLGRASVPEIRKIGNAGLKNMDLILTFGGDGTFLSAARRAHTFCIPIAGINVGNLGFLTDLSLENLESDMDDILKGKYKIVERMMLDVEVRRKNKTIWKDVALNDAVVSHSGKVKLLSLSAKSGNKFISRFWADGLIVATPTGSTAYSLSAGGPLLDPSVEVIVLTPICPHALTERPIILPADKELEIQVDEKRPPALVTVDGKAQLKLLSGDKVVIGRSRHKTRILKLGDGNHFDALRSKLSWSYKPEYK
jgi:NAD+ kinase